ncbi:MAG: hypothetical protein H6715_05845 [Myxococcales bacterium]|nr:hypothetical protein [Myxococcales bacterium]MCB9707885.1 hypothetical protein [Myxococcales bacterium]
MGVRWLVFLLVVGSATAVLAQDTQTQARQHFQEGVRKFDARDFDAALLEFKEAYRLKPHPSVLVNMANCYERLGKPVEAVEHFERYVEEAGKALSASEQREIKRTIARLNRSIGTLTLEVSPPSANVRINGQPMAREDAGGSMALAEGAHVLEIDASGYLPERRQIVIRGKERTVETIALAPRPSNVPSVVTATSDEGAIAGETLHLRLTTPVLVSGGITAALLAIAITTGALALSADSDFEHALEDARDSSLGDAQRQQAVKDGRDAADRANTLATVTDVLLVGSLIGAGVTAFLLFSEAERRPYGEKTEAKRVVASPYIDMHQAGLMLRGRF